MLIKEHLTEIIAFFTGGGLLSILNFWRDSRKDKTEELNNYGHEWKSLYSEMLERSRVSAENEKQCEERYQQLTEEMHNLKMELAMLKAEFHKPQRRRGAKNSGEG